MKTPSELRYSKDHEWIKLEGDMAIIGITDFAQSQLTDIVFIELPEVGKKVEQHKQIAVIESVKSVSDVFSPMSGEVVEVNSKLSDNPEIINKDPYGEGWIAKIKINNKSELDSLLTADKYSKLIQ